VHPGYAQPPLDYYVKIFGMHPEKAQFVFYEDDKNPVVNQLKHLYPLATFGTVSQAKIIGIFMNAEHIVSGNGTFLNAIILFNNNLKAYYYPSNIPRRSGCYFGVGLPNYITTWQNTEEQRRFMLEYKSALLP
jgi:hypothetical protein